MKPILDRKDKRKGSIFDLAPHPSGPLLIPWTREELLDEMPAGKPNRDIKDAKDTKDSNRTYPQCL